MQFILSGLATPVLRYIVLGLMFMGFVTWQRYDAARDATLQADLKYERIAQSAEKAERERIERANRETLRGAELRAEAAEKAAAATQEKADELIAELDEANARCAIPDGLLRELRAMD